MRMPTSSPMPTKRCFTNSKALRQLLGAFMSPPLLDARVDNDSLFAIVAAFRVCPWVRTAIRSSVLALVVSNCSCRTVWNIHSAAGAVGLADDRYREGAALAGGAVLKCLKVPIRFARRPSSCHIHPSES